ncbi:unnamed protein product [Protopolystoma xenopodis]|uniref:Uncharacterized protein n=1 Tax=Protopolystoma xenopodis TaxID=117903 RepID=A0A448X4Z8_9PLAT|nr:unnamed protein product [Protopolystoma xenopodis]
MLVVESNRAEDCLDRSLVLGLALSTSACIARISPEWLMRRLIVQLERLQPSGKHCTLNSITEIRPTASLEFIAAGNVISNREKIADLCIL